MGGVLNIGSLNKQIIIQYPTKSVDVMGTPTDAWNDGDTIYAAIWPFSAAEQIQSMASTLLVSHRIRIRYRSDIKANWRLKYRNSYFNIISIIDKDMKHKMLEILTQEVA